ncbi:hypothetical protein B4144_4156 [Bacillus atrophaeus]|nr:hypothetical protein B4144_4156 [Bacillus atrophaeus]
MTVARINDPLLSYINTSLLANKMLDRHQHWVLGTPAHPEFSQNVSFHLNHKKEKIE